MRSGQDTNAFRPKNGESWDDCTERAKRFIRSVMRQLSNQCSKSKANSTSQKLLVVSHGGFIVNFLKAAH